MDKNKSANILVIRLSAMGDVAMTVPVLKCLTETYPGLQLTVLTKSFFKPVFEPLERVSVYNADVKVKHKGLRGLWKLYRELSGMGFDAVADLHHVLRSNILKRFFNLESLPFVQIDKGRAEKKALVAARDKIFKPLEATHLRYARVFAELGYPVDLALAKPVPRQALTASAQALAGQDHLKWIGVAPFAAFKGKQYPLPLMEQVLRLLEKTDKYKIFLFGGIADSEKLQGWSETIKNCINTSGILSFREELALISNLDLMLSMDSGNAHLSANFGIPTVTLWGVTHPFAGFYPFGQDLTYALLADRDQFPAIPTSVYGNRMPSGYEKAMETIRPEEVVAKIEEVLSSP